MAKKRSKMNESQINNNIRIEKVSIDKSYEKKDKNSFINILTFFSVISALGYFFGCIIKLENLKDIIMGLLLLIFTMFFVSVSKTNPSRKKGSNILALVILLVYQVFGILIMFGLIKLPTVKSMDNLVGKSLTEVISYASDNKLNLKQDYEYSDLVDEYHVIYQSVKSGTKLKDVKELVVTISEGANPYKEIILPNMIGWNSERVLDFIKKNHLTNVDVSFIESEKQQDTLIEQSKSGNIKRNDEIKLTFSVGEKFDDNEIKLIDFTNKSKFEVIFYLKQHRIRYEFDEKFSNKIKYGYAVSQSIKPGTLVKAADEKIKVSISKGPKIKVPDLGNMNVTEITNWIIKNKLKVEFKNSYDDNVKENFVISSSHNKGDIVQQGTVITINISKGKLKMPKFKTLNEFREWADKYGIKYEEKYEFSDSVVAGDVISYSYKTGDVIKNNDSIIVTISDGEKIIVPDLKGLTKSEVISKLKKIGLDYNFVYKSSNKVTKGEVISQSISASSEVSKGTTVTVTLSSGKETYNREEDKSSNNNNNNSNNSGSSKPDPTPTPQPPSCEKKTYTIGRDLNNIFKQSGFSTVSSALYSFFASNYPNVKIRVVGVDGGDMTSGSYIGGIGPGSEVTSCNGVTYTIEIAK